MTFTPHRRIALGFLLSCLMHGGIAITAAGLVTTASLGIEFEVPLDVDFGMTEASAMLATAPIVAAPPPPPSTPAPLAVPETVPLPDAKKLVPDAGTPRDAGPDGATLDDASLRDAGLRDASVDAAQDAGVITDSGVATSDAAARDARTSDGGAPNADAGSGRPLLSRQAIPSETRLPAGAQIAIRLDMARVRESTIAADVERLLHAIPDWRALLDGSGIEPLRDLERVMIASPDLTREKLVIAGKATAAVGLLEAVVERMATARGTTTQWRTMGTTKIADWPNLDATPRVVALLGNGNFIVCREVDLNKVLAVANAKLEASGGEAVNGADALLWLQPNEVLSVEVEGARRYARGASPEQIPEKARASITQTSAQTAHIEATATFDSTEQATAARARWSELRDYYARDMGVALLGFSAPLRSMRLETQEAELSAATDLRASQLKMAISYLEGMLGANARAPAGRLRERPAEAPQQPR